MSIIDELITDRTYEDGLRADYLESKRFQDMTPEEQAEYLSPLRGRYNASDLNRVQAALEYVSNRLQEEGYILSPYPYWNITVQAWPFPDIVQKYLDVLKEMRSCFSMPASTPAVPRSFENMSYTTANDIEKILYDVDTLLTGAEQSRFCSGDVYSGEV